MIALLGYGKTTKALAQKIKHVIIFEDIKQPFIDEDGFRHEPFEHFDPDNFHLVIPSPGMPPSHPVIKQAKEKIISEYDYFANQMPYSIWVSGTNGKTTTTQMIQHLLKDKGAVAGGNIGTPLANMDENAKIWILETSSFTLHYTKIAKPNLYILLPITPDHLSWHGDFASYEAAKLKPIKKLKEGEVAIVPKKYLDTPTHGYLIGYESVENLIERFDIDPVKINFQGAFLLDAMLALAVQYILFHKTEYDKINSFRLDPHKQEEFFDQEGRLWVDDSKATNIDATLEAIKRYQDRHIHLILGGDNKGVSLEPLVSKLQNATLYAIGKATKHIMELAQKYSLDAVESKTLENAVSSIKKQLKKDEVALLSPACASLDQFTNYKERGKLFKKFVLS